MQSNAKPKGKVSGTGTGTKWGSGSGSGSSGRTNDDTTGPILSFADLLRRLAGGRNKRPALALALGRKYWEVAYWERTNYAPEDSWDGLMALAKEKNIPGITLEFLHDLARKSRAESA